MDKIFCKMIYPQKIFHFCHWTQPLCMNTNKIKKGPWNQLLVSLFNCKYIQKYPLLRDLPLGWLWCLNWKWFQRYSQNCIANLCQTWRHKYSIFQLPLWMEKVGEGEEELQKIEYLVNEKRLLGNKKTFFMIFKGRSFGEYMEM